MQDPPIAALLATFLLAGLVKGITGMGLPTVAVGLLGAIMPPAQAAALVVLPSALTNIWQALAGGALRPLLHRLWPLLLGIGIGTAAGAGLAVDARAARFWLGLALLAQGGLGLLALAPPRLEPRREAPLGGLAGLANGVVAAITGVFVLPSVPYLQALGLGREALVQALGLTFTAATLALAVVLGGQGWLSGATLGWSALALLPALAGMALGQVLRRRLSPLAFRRAVSAGLLLLGLHLAWRGLGG